jgi:phage host-nuclease inhibitor protein Gam
VARAATPKYQDWAEADAALSRYAEVDATINAIGAEIDLAVERIRARYADRLAPLDAEQKVLTTALRKWLKKRLADLGDERSITRVSGTLGLRTGNPRVEAIDPDWDEDDIIESLETHIPKFVRTVPEVDREGILRAVREQEISAETLAKAGLEVRQSEKFYIDLAKCGMPQEDSRDAAG